MNLSAEKLKLKAADSFELQTALESSLTEFFGTERRIIQLERQPSDYRSSFGLEKLTVELENGTLLSLIFKDLSWDALLENGKRAKPEFLYEPEREIEVYNKILMSESPGIAICYGASVNMQIDRYWLFLENVRGVELYQVGDFEVWKNVACWLAGFHSRFADKINYLSGETKLLKYDEALYREWMRRAQIFFATDEITREAGIGTQVDWLAGKYDRIVEALEKLPKSLLHGEFYASNVLIQFPETENSGVAGTRVCPIDWEMTGVGPSLIDLAALTGGNWKEKEKKALASSYYNALPQKNEWFPSQQAFETSLQYCQLYLAVQWVGWFGRRRPFAAHAQDWLSEAVRLAEELGL